MVSMIDGIIGTVLFPFESEEESSLSSRIDAKIRILMKTRNYAPIHVYVLRLNQAEEMRKGKDVIRMRKAKLQR